jgi:phosphohistidine phosphatase
MKRLLLLRHAKAEPADGAEADRDRRLAGRGRSDVAIVAVEMHRRGYAPDRVLCSDAARTRETWTLAAGLLGGGPLPIELLDELYLAPPEAIAERVRTAMRPSEGVALVIGHNPGLADFVLAYSGRYATEGERNRRAAVRAKFPTCALAVIDFAVTSWSGVAPGGGTLVDFLAPRMLSPR